LPVGPPKLSMLQRDCDQNPLVLSRLIGPRRESSRTGPKGGKEKRTGRPDQKGRAQKCKSARLEPGLFVRENRGGGGVGIAGRCRAGLVGTNFTFDQGLFGLFFSSAETGMGATDKQPAGPAAFSPIIRGLKPATLMGLISPSPQWVALSYLRAQKAGPTHGGGKGNGVSIPTEFIHKIYSLPGKKKNTLRHAGSQPQTPPPAATWNSYVSLITDVLIGGCDLHDGHHTTFKAAPQAFEAGLAGIQNSRRGKASREMRRIIVTVAKVPTLLYLGLPGPPCQSPCQHCGKAI